MLRLHNRWILSIAICPILSSPMMASSQSAQFRYSFSKSCSVHDLEGEYSPLIPRMAQQPATKKIGPAFSWSAHAYSMLQWAYQAGPTLTAGVWDRLATAAESIPGFQTDSTSEPNATGIATSDETYTDLCGHDAEISECCPLNGLMAPKGQDYVALPENGIPPGTIESLPIENRVATNETMESLFPSNIIPRNLLLHTVLEEEYQPYDLRVAKRSWFISSPRRSVPPFMPEPGMPEMGMTEIGMTEIGMTCEEEAFRYEAMDCDELACPSPVQAQVRDAVEFDQGAAIGTTLAETKPACPEIVDNCYVVTESMIEDEMDYASLDEEMPLANEPPFSPKYVSVVSNSDMLLRTLQFEMVRGLSFALKHISNQVALMADWIEQFAGSTNVAQVTDSSQR